MRDSNPSLTVVLPVRSAFRELQRSLEVLAPLGDAVERIVVDGSDENGERISTFLAGAPPWNKLLTGAQNGVYAAMNEGVRSARGRYVLFCGAGDLVDVTILADWLAEVPTASTLCAFAVHMGEHREAGVPAVRRPKWGASLVWQNHIHHQGLIAPRSWILDTPFDERLKVLADYQWILKMWLAGHPMSMHEGILTRAEGGGLSRQFTAQLYREEWRMKQAVLPWRVMCLQGIWIPAKWAFKRVASWAR